MHSISWPLITKSKFGKVLSPRYFSAETKLVDSELVKNALGGNNHAFKQLIERYLKPIYNFLYQLTRDYSSLDDLAQETFVKAWRNLSRFDSSKSFKVWIFTIARNTAYDFLRKKKELPFSSLANEETDKLEQVKDSDLLPQEFLEREEAKLELETRLEMVADNQRLILLLRYTYDFSLKEIAETLKEPYNTIKSRHKRALLSLKNEFKTPKACN